MRMPKMSRTPIIAERIWSPLIDVTKYILVVTAITWLMVNSTKLLGYNWQWYRVPEYIVRVYEGGLLWGPLTLGFIETIRLSAISFVLLRRKRA